MSENAPLAPNEAVAFANALSLDERTTPEKWFSDRHLDAPPDPSALAVLRSIRLLFRNRRALGSLEGFGEMGAAFTPCMSGPAGTTGGSSGDWFDDRDWFAANKLVPIGRLDVAGGGMGDVGLAWHVRMKREVVLKIPRGPEKIPRFEREIQLHAKLGGHEKIAVTRSPLDRGGTPVLVVDYVPGPNLRRLVKTLGPLPVAEACDCVRQAAEGLAHAHGLGVIHRDVKSANLVRSTRDGGLKIIDWGLALDRASMNSDLTGAGFVGTPAYAPPELFEGDAAATAASDLYSLGCVFHELLAGSPPFADSAKPPSRAHREEEVPPLDPALGVPPAVEAVLRKLLDKKPEDRYQDARSLIADLDRATKGRPIDRRLWMGGGLAAVAGATALVVLRPLGKPRVERFDIEVIDPGPRPTRSGPLGRLNFDVRRGDQVEIHAALTAPAYFFLLSFRPDGVMELCHPSDERVPPAPTDAPRFPPSRQAINLVEGTGLQAFALLVWTRPVLDFQTWRSAQEPPPWRAAIPADPGRVWSLEGETLETLLPTQADPTRSAGAATRGARGTLLELIGWLKARPGVTAIALKAFAVQPTS